MSIFHKKHKRKKHKKRRSGDWDCFIADVGTDCCVLDDLGGGSCLLSTMLLPMVSLNVIRHYRDTRLQHTAPTLIPLYYRLSAWLVPLAHRSHLAKLIMSLGVFPIYLWVWLMTSRQERIMINSRSN